MTMKLACGDVVEGCAKKFEAPNEGELLKQVAEHASTAHGVKEVPPELLAKVRAAIQTS